MCIKTERLAISLRLPKNNGRYISLTTLSDDKSISSIGMTSAFNLLPDYLTVTLDGMGHGYDVRLRLFVYLSVCLSAAQFKKRMIPKCSNLGSSRNNVHGFEVNKCIFHANDYYGYVNAHLTDNSNTAWVRTL